MALAITSLPVPVSPVIDTLILDVIAFSINPKVF